MADEKKQKTDPYLAYKFWVQIDGINVAGFTECSPITVEHDVLDYPEGGLNHHAHKLMGRMKWSNITLKHGIDPGGDLLYWFHKAHEDRPNRKNISITIYDIDGAVVQTYHLLDAYPVKWTSPDLRADPGAVAIETIEFAHNGLDKSQDKGRGPSGGGASPGGGGAAPTSEKTGGGGAPAGPGKLTQQEMKDTLE